MDVLCMTLPYPEDCNKKIAIEVNKLGNKLWVVID